jgi:hypothetical protein
LEALFYAPAFRLPLPHTSIPVQQGSSRASGFWAGKAPLVSFPDTETAAKSLSLPFPFPKKTVSVFICSFIPFHPMPAQTPEDPDAKPTQLFFPVMSTLLFVCLAIYELPAPFGWVYLLIAVFGFVTVYLSWKKNQRRRQEREGENGRPGARPGNRQ